MVESEQLGYYFSDRVALTHDAANLSAEPDGLYCSFAALEETRVTLVEGVDEGFVELEGTLDIVLEVVSTFSVRKDTKVLRELYWRAGIPEYWLVDARKAPVQFDILRRTGKGYAPSRRQRGWLRSKVLGRSFLIESRPDRLGHPQFFLRVEP